MVARTGFGQRDGVIHRGCWSLARLASDLDIRKARFSAADLYLVSKFLFWVFATGVIFLPPRWALLSMMLIMQIDVSVPGFVGTSSIGWENAIKALVLPILIFWRVAPKGWRNVIWTKSSFLWTAFVCYVALAALWSPYKLAAAKMVGYLLCYFILFWPSTLLGGVSLTRRLSCSLSGSASRLGASRLL